ncbi:MAG: hypothetical protein J6M24_00830 [Lachnospiraceae bacterium]|nr:hypothetical protein [Lachnospiraceae bacterium]
MPKKKENINNKENEVKEQAPVQGIPTPEFIGFYESKLPKWLMNTGNVSILNKFLNFHKDELPEKEKKYLQKKIETSNKINLFEKAAILNSEVTVLGSGENEKEKPEQKLKRKGNVVRLVNIHQPYFQKSRSGCWSHAYDMMLQSRGVHLSPEDIRSFRPEYSKADAEKAKNDTFRKLNMDIGRDPYTSSDLLMKVCPNTAMCEITFNGPEYDTTKIKNGRQFRMTNDERETYLKNYKKDLINNIKQKIIEAIEEDRCPVGIVYGGHYRTVTGINKKTGELYMKDSIPVLKNNLGKTEPDEDFKVSLKSIVEDNIFAPSFLKPGASPGGISITWLKDLPTKDNKLGNCISYEEDGNLKYTKNEATNTIITSDDTANQNGILRGKEIKANTIWDQSKYKFKAYGFSGDGTQVGMAYESYRVPDKIYTKGKLVEKNEPKDDYVPHSYDILLGSVEKYDTLTHDKLGNEYNLIPNMKDQRSIMALGDMRLNDFNNYIESVSQKIAQGGKKEDIDALKEDLRFVNEKKEQFTKIRNKVEENMPYARLSIMRDVEEEKRMSGKCKTEEEYKDSVYRSIALAQLYKRYQVVYADNYDRKMHKKNELLNALKPENLEKEIEHVKKSMSELDAGKSKLKSNFRNLFEKKLSIVFAENDPSYIEKNVLWKPADNASLAQEIKSAKKAEEAKKLEEQKQKEKVKENSVKTKVNKTAKIQQQSADEMEMEMILVKSASLLVNELYKQKDKVAKPGEALRKGAANVRDDLAMRLRSDAKIKEAMDKFDNLKNIAESIGYKICIHENIANSERILNDFVKAELPDKKVRAWNKENASALKKMKQSL